MCLSDDLRSRRITLGYTLKQASDKTGLSYRKIYAIEEGKNKLTNKLITIFNNAYNMRMRNE